jgi:hypothetical protein
VFGGTRVFDHLLAHGRYKIAVYTAHGSHRALCLVPTSQTELVAAFHGRPWFGHDFDDLKDISLFKAMSRVSEYFRIAEAYCTLDSQVFTAVDRRANGNEVFVSRLGT